MDVFKAQVVTLLDAARPEDFICISEQHNP
jgi:hypothetical protein